MPFSTDPSFSTPPQETRCSQICPPALSIRVCTLLLSQSNFLSRFFSGFWPHYTSILCVVDALDECSEDLRQDLIEKLEKLQPKVRRLQN